MPDYWKRSLDSSANTKGNPFDIIKQLEMLLCVLLVFVLEDSELVLHVWNVRNMAHCASERGRDNNMSTAHARPVFGFARIFLKF